MLNQITDSIKRWSGTREELEDAPERAHVLAVCSRKGGVGKTTTAVHLAVSAARDHGKQVLLVDMDPQGHVESSLASLMENVTWTGEPLSSILTGRRSDLMGGAAPTREDRLWLIPADAGLADAEMLLASRIGREFILRGVLKRARGIFDLVILDCPPNLGTMTLNALMAADSVLVPTDLSPLSLQGIADLADAVETLHDRMGHHIRINGILVTRRDGRTSRLNNEIEKKLEDRYGNLVYGSAIPMNSALGQACARGQSVYTFSPRSRGAEGYRKATVELLGRIKDRRRS